MKRVAFVTFLILSLSTISYTSGAADPQDRPAGVSAANWVPVSDRVGIVLVQSEAPLAAPAPRSQPLLLRPPVSGYYMIKGASGWTRLIIVEPLKGPADAG
jgi:hypothetical protein